MEVSLIHCFLVILAVYPPIWSVVHSETLPTSLRSSLRLRLSPLREVRRDE